VVLYVYLTIYFVYSVCLVRIIRMNVSTTRPSNNLNLTKAKRTSQP